MLPPVWSYARQFHLVTQPDFFAAKFSSPALGVLVALVGIVALVPYLVLQFTGLGIIVQVASYGAIPKSVSVVLGAAVVSLYVIVSGIRGSAWTAVVKDVLIILVAVFLGLYLPFHYQGGITAMFSAIDRAKARLPGLRGDRQKPLLVRLHRAVDGARLLHVAAILRRLLHGAPSRRIPQECDRAAAVSTRAAVYLLRRIFGGAGGAGPPRRGQQHGVAEGFGGRFPRPSSSVSSARPACSPRSCRAR